MKPLPDHLANLNYDKAKISVSFGEFIQPGAINAWGQVFYGALVSDGSVLAY